MVMSMILECAHLIGSNLKLPALLQHASQELGEGSYKMQGLRLRVGYQRPSVGSGPSRALSHLLWDVSRWEISLPNGDCSSHSFRNI